MQYKTGPQWVSPYIQTYKNRYVDPKRITTLINKQKKKDPKSNGWNPALAGAIDVAILDCPGHPLHGKMFRWDGGHRVEIFIQSGQEGDILANVSIVYSEEELKQLYETKNGKGSKRLSQEDLFVNNSHNEPDLVTVLNDSNLCVTNKVDVVGAPNSPNVKVQGIRTLRKKVSDASIAEASKILQETTNPQSNNEYPIETLSGVAIVLDRHTFTDKEKEQLKEYISAAYKLNGSVISRLHTSWKSSGGAVNAKGSESVALGILKGLKSSGVNSVKTLITSLKTELKL